MWSPLNQALAGSASAGGTWVGEAPAGAGSGWGSAADLLQAQASLGSMGGPNPLSSSRATGSPSSWLPGQQPLGPEPHGQNHSAAAKIYGLPQSLQHPVAVAGLFAPFGDVLDVKLYAAEVRLSGGSAVVRMRTTQQAAAAIAALNGIVPEGGWQQLTVRAAETAEQRSSRITAINGRQGLGPASPLALPPAGPAAASALRRAQSGVSRPASSASSLQCYTGGLVGGAGSDPLLGRRSADWAAGSCFSLDSSRRSSMDATRAGRSSSDSGSEEAPVLAAPAGAMQRMLLEAVLALVTQVEAGQLTLPAMRTALEAALSAAKQVTASEEGQLAAAVAATQPPAF